MSSPATIAAAKAVKQKLQAAGIPSQLKPVPNNEWLAKLETELGNICVYTNSKGKVSIQTHEIKNPTQRAAADAAIEKSEEMGKIPPTGILTAYTDGSAEGGQCGWACILFSPDGNKTEEIFGNLGPSPNQQIGGECEGAITSIQHAISTKQNLLIRHDLQHIAKWITEEFECNDPDGARLKTWASHAKKQGVEIQFEWTKGHSGNYGNERADALAAKATKLPPTPGSPNPRPTTPSSRS